MNPQLIRGLLKHLILVHRFAYLYIIKQDGQQTDFIFALVHFSEDY